MSVDLSLETKEMRDLKKLLDERQWLCQNIQQVQEMVGWKPVSVAVHEHKVLCWGTPEEVVKRVKEEFRLPVEEVLIIFIPQEPVQSPPYPGEG